MSRPDAVCDNKAVGALITDRDGRYLIFSRLAYPAGYAPVEGHVDDRRSFQAAITAAVSRQSGLAVTRLAAGWRGWQDNACYRRPGRAGTGHEWQVCHAEVAGKIQPGPGIEAVRLVTGPQLQQLANRTALYARGQLSDAAFAGRLGLRGAWVRILHEMRLVVMTDKDLTLTDRLAARPAPAGGAS
ncbi:MAG: hypothetical protein ACRDRJ_25705 [Streptosporangiaceae bacterium]